MVFFIMALWFKSYLDDIVSADSSVSNDFTHMYNCIDANQQNIFITLCKDASRIQLCSDDEKNSIFSNDPPSAVSVAVAAILEKYLGCSGINDMALPYFYFTDKET